MEAELAGRSLAEHHLIAHEHALVGAKLDLGVLGVGAEEEHREVVLGRVGEQRGQRAVKVAHVLLERVHLPRSSRDSTEIQPRCRTHDAGA